MRGEMSWYVARTGGFLAWGLSAFSILWGLLISSRALGKRISGPRLLDLHRFIGGLSVVFVLVHILALRLHSSRTSTSVSKSCSCRWHRIGIRAPLPTASSPSTC